MNCSQLFDIWHKKKMELDQLTKKIQAIETAGAEARWKVHLMQGEKTNRSNHLERMRYELIRAEEFSKLVAPFR